MMKKVYLIVLLTSSIFSCQQKSEKSESRNSIIAEKDSKELSGSELIESNPLSFDDYWKWLSNYLNDYYKAKAAGNVEPTELPAKWSIFLNATGYAPIASIEKDINFSFDLVLLRKVSDFNKPQYNYLLAIYKDGKLVREQIILQEENNDCEVEVNLSIGNGINKIEIHRRSCNSWEKYCLSEEAELIHISSADSISYQNLINRITYDENISSAYFNNHNIEHADILNENSFEILGETNNFLIGILKIADYTILYYPSYYLCSFAKNDGLLLSTVDLGYLSEDSSPARVEKMNDNDKELKVTNDNGSKIYMLGSLGDFKTDSIVNEFNQLNISIDSLKNHFESNKIRYQKIEQSYNDGEIGITKKWFFNSLNELVYYAKSQVEYEEVFDLIFFDKSGLYLQYKGCPVICSEKIWIKEGGYRYSRDGNEYNKQVDKTIGPEFDFAVNIDSINIYKYDSYRTLNGIQLNWLEDLSSMNFNYEEGNYIYNEKSRISIDSSLYEYLKDLY